MVFSNQLDFLICKNDAMAIPSLPERDLKNGKRSYATSQNGNKSCAIIQLWREILKRRDEYNTRGQGASSKNTGRDRSMYFKEPSPEMEPRKRQEPAPKMWQR